MNQPSLFDQPDPEEAARARADGIGQADAGATPAWKTAARIAIRHCANHLADFTADDVLERMTNTGAPRTGNLAALGPVFLASARAGEIRKTGGLRRSRYARRHRDLTVWTRG